MGSGLPDAFQLRLDLIAARAKANHGTRRDIPQNSAESFNPIETRKGINQHSLPQNSAEASTPIETREEIAKLAGVSRDTVDILAHAGERRPTTKHKRCNRERTNAKVCFRMARRSERENMTSGSDTSRGDVSGRPLRVMPRQTSACQSERLCSVSM
jgi:hypothetical protein